MADEATDVLKDVEARRQRSHNQELTAGEAELSINDWIGRLQGAAKTAHAACRAGSVPAEYDAWLDIVDVALGRLEQLRAVTP